MQYTSTTASSLLPILLGDLLDHGEEVGSRNGRVKEILNPQIVLTNPTEREILTPHRKANVFAQIAETMWVLSGRNDIEWLSAYLPRAKDFSDDGIAWRGGYGPRIRGMQYDAVDQLAYVIDTLRADPLSRRAVIAIYDPNKDLPPGKDVPCNDFLQFQSRLGKLHLTVTVRSNDVMWGWSGINAFEWSTLQEIVASLLGIHVGTLTFNIGSLHLYQQHWVKADKILSAPKPVPFAPGWGRNTPFNPRGTITSLVGVDRILDRWFSWEARCRTGDVAIGELLVEWEEPLFKAWAMAIAYFWTREDRWLHELKGTALHAAMLSAPTSVLPEPVQRPGSNGVAPSTGAPPNENVQAFYDFVTNLHAEKHASYGNSWMKRGEKMSILANIARKVDRLGVGDQYDSSADTVIDLWVYLAKYLCWLQNRIADPDNVDILLSGSLREAVDKERDWETSIPADFDHYADNIDEMDFNAKHQFVKELIFRVAPIARDLWLAENAGDEYRGADHD